VSIEWAKFMQRFTVIEILFTIPVISQSEGDHSNPMIPCAFFFADETVAALGVDPACERSADHTRVYVTLGQKATIVLGQKVITSASQSLAPLGKDGYVGEPAAQMSMETTSDEATELKAALYPRPARAQACTDVSFAATGSIGSYGRPLNFTWSLGDSTPEALKERLQGSIDKAVGFPAFTVDARVLWDAVKDTGVALPFDLEAKVVVTNWLKDSSEQSTIMEIVAEDSTDALAAIALTPTKLAIRKHASPKFAIKVLPIPASECSGFTPFASTIDITWEYKSKTGTEWVGMSSFPLVNDTNRATTIVEFGAFLFPANTEHNLRAVVTQAGKRTEVMFDFEVVGDPVKAVVWGPDTARTECTIEYNAGDSYDPDHNLEDGPDSAFHYTWGCEAIDFNTTCGDLNCSTEAPFKCQDAPDKSVLQVSSGAIKKRGLYRFNVHISRGGVELASDSTWTHFEDTAGEAGAPPPVVIESSWKRGDALSTARFEPKYKTLASVHPQASTSCPAQTETAFRWVLLDHTQGWSGPDSTMVVKILDETTATLKSFPEAEFRKLRSGGIYAFGLLVDTGADAASRLDSLAQHLPFYLEEASYKYEFQRYETNMFTAVAPPRGGKVYVAPRTGSALNEQFSLSTAGWSDLRYDWTEPGSSSSYSRVIAANPIEYSFFRFPVSTDAKLSYDNTTHALTCTGPCELSGSAQDTLYNTSSDDYYSRRGGSMITTWLSAGEIAATLPGGSYLTVAMVRDSLGGVNYAYAAGPLVTELKDLTADAVKDVLSQQINAGDSNAVLNAAEALAGMTSLPEKEQNEVKDAVINALQQISETMDSSAESVQKYGSAVEGLVESGVGSMDQVKKVTEGLSNVVEGATARVDGISEITGEGLINAVSSLAAASGDTTATAEESGDAAESFADLTASIGVGMAKDMEAGESRTIESDGLVLAVEVFEPAEQGETAVLGGDVVVPADVSWGRRLQANGDVVTNLDSTVTDLIDGRHAVIVTDWLQTNIFFKASHDGSSPTTYNVQKNADLKNVIVLKGNKLATLASPINLVMHVQNAPVGSAPMCLWWNTEKDMWSEEGVATAPLVASGTKADVTCSSMHASGTYAVIFTETVANSTTAKKSTSNAPIDHTGGASSGFGGGGGGSGFTSEDREPAGMSAGMISVIVILVLVFVACTVVGVGFGARMMRASDSMKQPMTGDFADSDERLDGASANLPTLSADPENPMPQFFQEGELDEPQVAISIDNTRGFAPEAQHAQANWEVNDNDIVVDRPLASNADYVGQPASSI